MLPPGRDCVLCSALLQRPDSLPMKKPPAPEEVGVPVSRNGSVLSLKSQNGYVPLKPSVGAPSPRLSKTPPNTPTSLDEAGKKVKKPTPLGPLSPSRKASQGFHGTSSGNGSRSESPRQGSWDGRAAALSTSPRLPAGGTANGHGPKAGSSSRELQGRGSCSSSPGRCANSDPTKGPQAPESGAARLGDSQGTQSRALPDGDDSRVVKPKAPVLSSTAAEAANIMSPPPAKKLALSAKKVGVWEPARRKCVSRAHRAGLVSVWGGGESCPGPWPPPIGGTEVV